MNNLYFQLYRFVHNPAFIAVRIIFLCILIITLLFINTANIPLALISIFYFLFVLNELFIAKKINTEKPRHTVTQAKDLEDAVAFPALHTLMLHADEAKATSALLSEKEVQFFLSKMGGELKVQQSAISIHDLLCKAAALVTAMKGTYIHACDIVASYILLTEKETQFLTAQDLSDQDILNMLYWTRNEFKIDTPVKKRFEFSGLGAFDNLMYGWNAEIKKYAKNFTFQVLSYPFPPSVVGRVSEYESMLVTLSKEQANNVILVGEPGTGKTSLVEYFTYKSHIADIESPLQHRMVYELLVDRLLAGANSKGELEERLTFLFTDIAYSGNVVLFIQNIENIFGGGGVDLDISGILYQYLKNGSIHVIGTTTNASFQTFLHNKQSVKDLFETVRLDEPNTDTALFMVFEKVHALEGKYGISLQYSAVKEAVMLSSSYDPDRYLPGKAINLLESVCSRIKLTKKRVVEKEDVIQEIESKTHIVLSKPTGEEKEKLLHLEDAIHERIIDQEQAVTAIASAMRRLRSGFTKDNRPISTFLFLGPTGAGKTETAKALAQIYFQNEDAMIRLDMSEFQTQDAIKKLLGASPGEEYVPNSFTEQVLQHPFSLILLDEFEKAHPQILDLFLQVFDDGRLTDNKGKTVSFVNTIIIATSNAGSEFIRQSVKEGADEALKDTLTEHLLKNNLFKPELLNRFDEVVIFKPLSQEHIREVVKLLLKNMERKLQEQNITIIFDDSVVDAIIKNSYSVEFGARNVRRYIEGTVEEFISTKILSDELKKGMSVHLSVDETGTFLLG